MPIDYRNYPPNWKSEIRPRIMARSGGKCEWCGAINYQPHPITGGKVVLTIAHLNHDTTDNRDENLAALCNKCHLTYDAPHHVANAKATRARKRSERIAASGQLELGDA
jgi:5-methylcytosine-specific restriction endonuclease McrA